MNKVKGFSVDTRLYRAELVVRGAWNHEVIKEAVARYKYDEVRLKQGMDLYTEAARLHRLKRNTASEKIEATLIFVETRDKLNVLYREQLQLARMALGDDPSFSQMLALNGKRKRRFAGWLDDVRQFYSNALSEPKVVQTMGKYGVTREDLRAGRKLLDEVDKAAAEQEKRKGISVKATRERDIALKALEKWVSDFLRICRLALGDSQHLEALGIVVPS